MFVKAFLLALLAISVFASTPIGVDPADAQKFSATSFSCKNKFGESITIDASKINDDYCDCADGSDEPGTSACATAERKPTMFYCSNKGYVPKRIFSAFVNDGICDCCDGSDEHDGKTKCQNTCNAEGQEIKQDLEAQIAAIRSGIVIKEKYAAEAKIEIEQKKAYLAEKKASLAIAEQEQTEAIAEKQRVEAIETAEKEALKEQKRLAKEEELKNAPPAEEVPVVVVEPVEPVEGETPTETPAPTPAPAPVEQEDEEVKNFKTEETMFTPVSNYLKQLILPLIRIFYPYYKMTEAEKARAVEKEKTLNVDTLKLEISRLETEVANDNGPELEFYHLRGKTIDVQVKQYTYTHKPFDTVEQKENNGGSTSLGRFDKWDNNYTVMHYTGGQTCWQGPARSTAVTLVCSGTSEMKISNVDEPSRCVYTMVMTTPAACKKSDLEELEKQLAQFLGREPEPASDYERMRDKLMADLERLKEILKTALVHGFLTLAQKVFYGKVSVRGVDRNLPAVGEAIILAGTHQNGLVDPVTIFSTCTTRRITGVAAVYLFKTPIVGWMLRALKAIPVTRPQDNNGVKTSNSGPIEAMASVLARHGAIFIFPEGTSHNNSIVLELKTGFARAAFIALQKNPELPRVCVVPVGLNYDAKNRFRSDVYVEYASPLIMDREWLKRFEEQPNETLKQASEIVRKKLTEVIISAPTPEALRVAHLARKIYMLPTTKSLTQEQYLGLTRLFVKYFEEHENSPIYNELVEMLKLFDDLGMSRGEWTRVEKLGWKDRLMKIVNKLPGSILGLPGSLYHAPIGVAAHFIGLKMAEGYSDQEAHFKMLLSIIVLPVYYTATAIPLWYFYGLNKAAATMAGIIGSGYFAINFRPLDTMRGLAKVFKMDSRKIRENIQGMRQKLRSTIVLTEEEKKLYNGI